jgi:hypothetical protein
VKDLRKQYPIHEHFYRDAAGERRRRREVVAAEEYFGYRRETEPAGNWHRLGKQANEQRKAEIVEQVRRVAIEPPPSTPAPRTISPTGIPSAERVGVPTLKMDGPGLEGVIMNALQIGSTSAHLGQPPPKVRVDVAGEHATVTFDETDPDDSIRGVAPTGYAPR